MLGIYIIKNYGGRCFIKALDLKSRSTTPFTIQRISSYPNSDITYA